METIRSHMWDRRGSGGTAPRAQGKQQAGRSAVAEESLRMVILKRLHPAGTPRETGEGGRKKLRLPAQYCTAVRGKNKRVRKQTAEQYVRCDTIFVKMSICLQMHEHRPGRALTNNGYQFWGEGVGTLIF